VLASPRDFFWGGLTQRCGGAKGEGK
jgi:hypothetical protein